MSKKINLLVLFCCVQIVVARGQSLADSLNNVLSKKELSPENRVMTMGLLARAISVTETDHAVEIGQQTLQLSRTLKDDRYKAFAHATLVQLYYQHNEIAKAQLSVDSAIWFAGKTTDRQVKGIAWYRKGWLENLQGKTKEAVSSSLEALKYFAGTNSPNYEASVYYIIGGIYAEWRDLPTQHKYARLCMIAAINSGEPDNLLAACQALATYYHYAYMNSDKDRILLDSAVIYNRNAISQFSARPLIFRSTLAVIALNTANLYEQYFPARYKDSVFHYLHIALKIGLETRHLSVVANCYGIMSDYEVAKGNYQKAEELLLEGLKVLRTDSANSARNIAQFMEALSKLAEKKGDHTSALKYYKEYHQVLEELFDTEKLGITKRLEAQYQSEKNEATLKTLQQTASLHKKLNYLYIFFVIAAIAATIFLFVSFHFRLKATLNQQKLLEKEKEDAELHAHLKEEEIMRSIAEQQLLQERQDRLQRDLLAGSLQVEQKDELLQAVLRKIEENKGENAVLKQINQIIDHNKRIDDTIGAYKADFDNIHPEFFEKLKEKSANTLSRLDLKHCSYISIGLTNKEIAQRLGIAPKSILMARYRIKLKLGLSKEIDLDEYIGTL